MSTDSSYYVSSASSQSTSSNTQLNNYSLTSISYMDDLVKEYLLFRGFNSSLKSYEHDLKQDKEKCFKPDKVTDQLLSYVYSYDLNGLLDFWSYLENKYFSRLTLKLTMYTPSSLTRKYELFLLRYYLINSIQTSRNDKAIELLENYASKLQSQIEWKEWYCLPFLKNPEENQTFSVYFSKNWIDTFLVSLQNFLTIVIQSVQFPRLLNYDEDTFWNTNFLNNNLKQQQQQLNKNSNSNVNFYYQFEQDYLQNEIIDEFQLLDSDSNNRQGNTFINMLKNFTSNSNKTSKTSSTNKTNELIITKQNQQQSKLIIKNENLTKIQEQVQVQTRRITVPSINDLDKQSEEQKDEKEDDELSDTKSLKSIQNINENLSNLSNDLLDDLNQSKNELYLILSQDEYKEHKSAILNCKFSYDGKYIVSVDLDGLIKIWSIETVPITISTLTQKGSAISLEWDKRNLNILYIGTRSNSVKVYDVIQKKVIQELNLNKNYQYITSICSHQLIGRTFIFTCSKSNQSNGQMYICETNLKNLNLIIEKILDFNQFYCQSSASLRNNQIMLGCSDGSIRIYDYIKQTFQLNEKCHFGSVLNIHVNKNETVLISIANDCLKIWKLFENVGLNFQKELQINNFILESDNVKVSGNSTCFDSSENYLFILDKQNGAYLNYLNVNSLTNDNYSKTIFVNNNSTCLNVWNANHLCILLIGSTNNTLRIYKLLHQF